MGWRGNMIGYDSETTGVDVESARIVTACIGHAGLDGWEAHTWLLRQSEPIPAEATAVHGITTEEANRDGIDPAVALSGIRDALYRAWAEGVPVVGHNVSYDLTVLDRELRRHGLSGLEICGPVLDTLVLDKLHDRYRRGSRKLVDVAAHYGITLTEADAHGAEADALASCRIMWKMGGYIISPEQAHAAQVDAYREQRESFASYLASKGEALEDTNTVWPLKPYTTN